MINFRSVYFPSLNSEVRPVVAVKMSVARIIEGLVIAVIEAAIIRQTMKGNATFSLCDLPSSLPTKEITN